MINIDTGRLSDAKVADLSLLARYTFADTASVIVRGGRVNARGNDGDVRIESIYETSYVPIGAEFDFGHGTLFGSRSLSAYGL